MKLIRLTTTDSKAIFQNTFNEDIIIEPNSRIALHSLTTQVQTEQLVIDAQNDEFEFSIGGNIRTIHLKHGTYDKTNIDDFFGDFTDKLNGAMEYTVSELSRQMLVSTALNKFTLQLKTGVIMTANNTNLNDPTYKFLGSKNVVSTNNYITRANVGTPLSMDSFIYFKSPITKGCGSFRARIYNESSLNGGYVMALLSEPVNENTTVIDPTKIVFGVRFIDIEKTYKIYKNGEEAPSTVYPIINTDEGGGENDMMCINIYRGKIRAMVVNTDTELDPKRINNGLEIDTLDYNNNDDLYPVMVFVSNTTQIANKIQCSSDPFYNDNNNILVENNDTESFGAVVGLYKNYPATMYIAFNDIDLAKALGFTSNRIPKSPPDKKTDLNGIIEFQAVKTISYRDLADTYLIELLNLNVNSYDSLKKQHMNLLQVIPQFDAIRERIIYSAVYPVFLSLNNPYRINLREIRARILKEDLTEVNATGYSQMTILIDN